MRRRDLLIEHLHLIQDQYGHLSAAHLRALAEEMRLSQAEVYEVASFYAHFDIVKEGDEVWVKCIGMERGKVKLSMKVVDQETGEDISDQFPEKPKRDRRPKKESA